MSAATTDIHTPPGRDLAFAAILAVLREHTGIDFTRYRVSTITRRVLNRMISVGAGSFEQYLHTLRTNDQEPLRLLERVTIKVSRFYRNPITFDALRATVLPELARAAAGAPLSIWSAGCGCGEEPYTLAMLLEEAGLAGEIEATDIDPFALDAARGALYPQAAFAELPAELQERYCERVGERVTVNEAVRGRVRFARHDLTAAVPHDGAPFDLVCCRNVLIYFERSAQERAMTYVRRAVRSGGYLCLGEAEWPLPAVPGRLEALSHKTRVFRVVDAQGQTR